MSKKKPEGPKLVPLPAYVNLWRFRTPEAEVVIYPVDGELMALERVNFILDCAKREIMK